MIIIGKFHHLLTLNPYARVWVAFGTGKHISYLNINVIYHTLRQSMSLALPFFHRFTKSRFFGMGKSSWKWYPDVTSAFTHTALNPYLELDIDSQYFCLLECYTVVLYDQTNELDNVDTARMELFCHGNKSMEKIPPTQCTLFQHLKHAAYQTSIW